MLFHCYRYCLRPDITGRVFSFDGNGMGAFPAFGIGIPSGRQGVGASGGVKGVVDVYLEGNYLDIVGSLGGDGYRTGERSAAGRCGNGNDRKGGVGGWGGRGVGVGVGVGAGGGVVVELPCS